MWIRLHLKNLKRLGGESWIVNPQMRCGKIVQTIHDGLINAKHKLIQFMIVHRLHYSPSRLQKIFPYMSSQCINFQSEEGTLSLSILVLPWTTIILGFSEFFTRRLINVTQPYWVFAVASLDTKLCFPLNLLGQKSSFTILEINQMFCKSLEMYCI